jgi:flagellar secretion chaperone FliS
MRQYQHQAVMTCTPEQLILKLYDLGVTACNRGDKHKLRGVLTELMGALNLEDGGDVAQRLLAVYEFCLVESGNEDLSTVHDLLVGLRDAWRDGVMALKAA